MTESIMAMVIIAVCLSITIIVYVRVLNTDRNIPSYLAEQKVKALWVETIKEKSFANEDFSYDSYQISKVVEELSVAPPVYQVQFVVKAGNQKNKYDYIIAN